jgi:uncharacterized membrane protein YkvA (DUF1232 family)
LAKVLILPPCSGFVHLLPSFNHTRKGDYPYFKLGISAAININKEHTMASEMNDKKFVKEFVRKGAKKITDDDVENVVKKADDIKEKFGASGPLGRFVEDAQMLIAIVKDYWAGTYRQIPYGSLAAIVFTMAYVLNPLDLIPDVLPVIGQVDDSLVVGACLLLVEQDLYIYKNWKTENDKDKTTAA